jgi:hemerythrin-like metal-binding protein
MPSINIFPWDENFNTGLELVDSQHRRLVDLLNVLAGHIVFHSDLPELASVLDELSSYAAYHFEAEEAIWNEFFNGDSLEIGHRANHESFITTIGELRELETRHSPELLERILAFLTRWLASHILERDRHAAMVVFALQAGMNLEEAKIHAEKQMSGSTRVLIDIILSVYSTLSSNAIELMREVSARKKANTELLQFTEVLAHHLQEPVRAQLLYTSLLKKIIAEFGPRDDIDNAFRNVSNGAERLRLLLRDMESYLSIASAIPKPGPCDTDLAVRNALEILHEKVRAKGAIINLAPLAPVISIKDHLSDVFVAIIDNCLTYSKKDTPVVVDIFDKIEGDGTVTISIEDNGIGISEEFADRVFKVFERLNHYEAHTGTGIGLAIAKKIIDLSNGKIWIDRSYRRGTRVAISLMGPESDEAVRRLLSRSDTIV